MSKDEGGRNSSLSEKPVRSRLRRLVDWINLTGAKKVHFIDRQSVQAEEPGDGLGEGEGEPGKRRCRWAESGGFRNATEPAVGSAAARAERGYLSTSAGTTTPVARCDRECCMHIPKRSRSIVFMDRVRQHTKRTLPLKTKELIAGLNPLLRGWGEYYKRAHVRRLFHRLDGWIRRRIWSHRYKHWRNAGWTQLTLPQLYGEYELVRLLDLIPSLSSRRR
jgi:hypothetical protein